MKRVGIELLIVNVNTAAEDECVDLVGDSDLPSF